MIAQPSQPHKPGKSTTQHPPPRASQPTTGHATMNPQSQFAASGSVFGAGASFPRQNAKADSSSDTSMHDAPSPPMDEYKYVVRKCAHCKQEIPHGDVYYYYNELCHACAGTIIRYNGRQLRSHSRMLNNCVPSGPEMGHSAASDTPDECPLDKMDGDNASDSSLARKRKGKRKQKANVSRPKRRMCHCDDGDSPKMKHLGNPNPRRSTRAKGQRGGRSRQPSQHPSNPNADYRVAFSRGKMYEQMAVCKARMQEAIAHMEETVLAVSILHGSLSAAGELMEDWESAMQKCQ